MPSRGYRETLTVIVAAVGGGVGAASPPLLHAVARRVDARTRATRVVRTRSRRMSRHWEETEYASTAKAVRPSVDDVRGVGQKHVLGNPFVVQGSTPESCRTSAAQGATWPEHDRTR